MMKRSMMRLVLLLVLANVMSGCGLWETRRDPPPPSVSADELRTIGEQELQKIIRNPTYLQMFGGDPNIKLGAPYKMYGLPFSAFDSYRSSSRLGALIGGGQTWKFPVLVDGVVVGNLGVGYVDGRWQDVGIDSGTQLQTLIDFLARPENQALPTPVLVNFAPLGVELALFNKGFDEQLLPLNDGTLQLIENRPMYPAPEDKPMYPAPEDRRLYQTKEVMPQIIKAWESKSVW